MNKNDLKNCPNCGAPIKHRYNHKCEYCGTFFDYRIKEIEKINPKNLKNVKLDRIERDYESNCVRLIFVGEYYKIVEAIEYTGRYVEIDVESFKPRKMYYAINITSIEFFEFMYNGNFEFIFEILPFEIEKRQFIENLINYRKCVVERW